MIEQEVTNYFQCALRANARVSSKSRVDVVDIRFHLFFDLSNRDRIVELRACTDPDKKDKLKDNLPALSPSTTATLRTDEASVAAHTGAIVLDFDDLDEIVGITPAQVREALALHMDIALVGVSPSSTGVKALCLINPIPKDIAEHNDAFKRVCLYFEEYLKEKLGLDIPSDLNCQNPERLCFKSYDPFAKVRSVDDLQVINWRTLKENNIDLEQGKAQRFNTYKNTREDYALDPPIGSMRSLKLFPAEIVPAGGRKETMNKLMFHGYVNLLWSEDYVINEALDVVNNHMEQPPTAHDRFEDKAIYRLMNQIKRDGSDEREKNMYRQDRHLDSRMIFNMLNPKRPEIKLLPNPLEHFNINEDNLYELTDRGNSLRYLIENGVYVNWLPGRAEKGVIWNFYDNENKVWFIDTSLVDGSVAKHILSKLDEALVNANKIRSDKLTALKQVCDQHSVKFSITKQTIKFDKAYDSLADSTKSSINKLKADYLVDQKQVSDIRIWRHKCSTGTARSKIAVSYFDTEGASPLRMDNAWDNKIGFGNTKDGVLDFLTCEMTNNLENIFDYHTHRFPRSVIPELLDKEDEVIAPEYMKFLTQMQPDKDIREYLNLCNGYALTGRADLRFMLLHTGTGHNGKSVQLEILRSVFGLENGYGLNISWTALAPMNHAEAPTPQRVKMAGARLITITEWPEDQAVDTTFLKSFTGGDDIITARALNSAPIEFKPQALLQVASNYLPKVFDSSSAMWDRIRLIKWGVTIPRHERLPTLANDIISKESDRIFTLFVKYAKRYMTEEMIFTPAAILRETRTYQEREDSMADFFSENLEYTKGSRVSLQQLFQVYRNRTNSRMTSNSFGKRFREYIDRYNAEENLIAESDEKITAKIIEYKRTSTGSAYMNVSIKQGNIDVTRNRDNIVKSSTNQPPGSLNYNN